MAERSGIGAQIGVATEETVGTYKAPSRFIPFESESLILNKEYVRSKGLRAGRLAQAKNLHIATTRSVSGDVQTEFLNQGMGILLNILHGETVTPEQIGGVEGLGYKQIHKLGISSPFGKALTIQVGRPDTGGTVRAFSYLGCKIITAALSFETSGIAMLNLTVDGKDETTAEALGSATYDNDTVPFNFTQLAVKFGESEVANMRNLTFNISVPQNTERYNLGNSGVKDQPIANALVEITAEATLEFSSLADHERFKNAETVKLIATATGAEIDASADFKTVLTAAAAKQVSSGPTVQGEDIITTDVSFECLDDGTNPALEIEYVSSDSAL